MRSILWSWLAKRDAASGVVPPLVKRPRPLKVSNSAQIDIYMAPAPNFGLDLQFWTKVSQGKVPRMPERLPASWI